MTIAFRVHLTVHSSDLKRLQEKPVKRKSINPPILFPKYSIHKMFVALKNDANVEVVQIHPNHTRIHKGTIVRSQTQLTMPCRD